MTQRTTCDSGQLSLTPYSTTLDVRCLFSTSPVPFFKGSISVDSEHHFSTSFPNYILIRSCSTHVDEFYPIVLPVISTSTGRDYFIPFLCVGVPFSTFLPNKSGEAPTYSSSTVVNIPKTGVEIRKIKAPGDHLFGATYFAKHVNRTITTMAPGPRMSNVSYAHPKPADSPATQRSRKLWPHPETRGRTIL